MKLGRWLLGVGFITAGVMHFVATPVYIKIVPTILPEPRLLVQISGAAEILGGAGVLLPPTRRAAAWGLVALLLAVWPANVSMALDHARWPATPEWLLWTRLPLQIPLLAWAWVYTRRTRVKHRLSVGKSLKSTCVEKENNRRGDQAVNPEQIPLA